MVQLRDRIKGNYVKEKGKKKTKVNDSAACWMFKLVGMLEKHLHPPGRLLLLTHLQLMSASITRGFISLWREGAEHEKEAAVLPVAERRPCTLMRRSFNPAVDFL